MNELFSGYNLFTPSWNILGCLEGVKNSFIKIFHKYSPADGLFFGHSMPGGNHVMPYFRPHLKRKE